MLINERPEENRHPDFDSEASMREAIARYPIERVLEQFGCHPINGSWKKMVCPFCQKKTSSGVFVSDTGVSLFKCHSTSCKSGTTAMGPVQVIAMISGLSQRDAFISYLKMADVWKDRTKFKSLPKPGSETAPSGNGAPKAAEDGRDGGPGPQTTSLQGDAAVGPGEVNVASPAQQTEPNKTAPLSVNEKSAEGAVDNPDDAKGQKEEATGAGVPGTGPSVPSGSASPGAGKDPVASAQGDCGPAPGDSGSSASSAPNPAPDAALAGANNAESASTKKLTGPAAPSGPVTISAKPVDKPAEPNGKRALLEYFSRLNLSNSDRDLLFDKRGLKWLTCHALRFRSNPKTNETILRELHEKYGIHEMLNSGLWLSEDRKQKKPRRPNGQFFGYGIKGKRKDSEESDEQGKFIWGWTFPVLIPYFDEAGELITLRPHKGMGRSGTLVGTPQLYVPRGAGGPKDGAPEIFHTVVITEGEFKAAALWQSLGVWRTDGKDPIGVAALPGISFGKNYEIREALEDWLHRVKCREVIVVFDNEEKGDENLESYKADRRKRFEAEKWARYLATALAQKLHILGKVGMLPNSWRNAKGKADWDGAAAEMAKGKKLEVVR